jgi:hypothetical protein
MITNLGHMGEGWDHFFSKAGAAIGFHGKELAKLIMEKLHSKADLEIFIFVGFNESRILGFSLN